MSSKKKVPSQAEKEEFLAEMLVHTARNLEPHGFTLEKIGVPALSADPDTCSGHVLMGVCTACRFNLCRKCGRLLSHLPNRTTIWSGSCGFNWLHTELDADSEEHHGRVIAQARLLLQEEKRADEIAADRRARKAEARRSAAKSKNIGDEGSLGALASVAMLDSFDGKGGLDILASVAVQQPRVFVPVPFTVQRVHTSSFSQYRQARVAAAKAKDAYDADDEF